MIQPVNQNMHYVNCIHINSETNYLMILIMHISLKQHIINNNIP